MKPIKRANLKKLYLCLVLGSLHLNCVAQQLDEVFYFSGVMRLIKDSTVIRLVQGTESAVNQVVAAHNFEKAVAASFPEYILIDKISMQLKPNSSGVNVKAGKDAFI